MLQQILDEMFVEPELLRLLSEEEKLVLFKEMRKEQVKRWDIKCRQVDEMPRSKKASARKNGKVGFHYGKDGKEWVWVLGEGEGDLLYEDLVRHNNRKKKTVKIVVSSAESIDGPQKDESTTIEEGWKEREAKAKEYEEKRRSSVRKAMDTKSSIRTVLDNIPPEQQTKITRRLSSRRESFKFRGKNRGSRLSVYGLENLPEVDYVTLDSIKGTKPAEKSLVIKWFRDFERPKCTGLERNGVISTWFHGMITRTEAEELLQSMANGSYLVRISANIWGYVLSVKCSEGTFKHYQIDGSQGVYQMVIKKNNDPEPSFSSLFELILYYRAHGSEVVLKEPCPQLDLMKPDYEDLLNDEDDLETTWL